MLQPISLTEPSPSDSGGYLALLWQEYKEAHPQEMQYNWFCKLYRAWTAKLDVVMRQEHRAGEKMFVGYAGQTVAVVDRETGELREAQIFVAVLGAACGFADHSDDRAHGAPAFAPFPSARSRDLRRHTTLALPRPHPGVQAGI